MLITRLETPGGSSGLPQQTRSEGATLPVTTALTLQETCCSLGTAEGARQPTTLKASRQPLKGGGETEAQTGQAAAPGLPCSREPSPRHRLHSAAAALHDLCPKLSGHFGSRAMVCWAPQRPGWALSLCPETLRLWVGTGRGGLLRSSQVGTQPGPRGGCGQSGRSTEEVDCFSELGHLPRRSQWAPTMLKFKN